MTTNDDINVHYSSGIYNKAFYTLATTSGWNTQEAFQVFARANRDYWTPNTTFDSGACGVETAATDLGYSAPAVSSAFASVGVSCPVYSNAPDIFAIKKDATSSNKTEVHILNGADGFKSYVTHKATVLAETGSDNSWVFGLGDYNGDGATDVYAIKKTNTGTNKTEVHILNGADGFKSYLTHKATVLGETGSDSSWVFGLGSYNGDSATDLYAIRKTNTGTNKTEVYVLNGADGFKSYLTHKATVLGETGANDTWALLVGSP